MTFEPRPTAGFTIHRVMLESCSFKRDFAAEALVRQPDAQGRLDLEVTQTKPSRRVNDRFVESMTVSARGFLGDIETWSAEVTYRGEFSLVDSAEVTLELASSLHVPAMLYGFIREHLADLTRRATIGPVLLPPMRFTPGSPMPATVSEPPIPRRKSRRGR